MVTARGMRDAFCGYVSLLGLGLLGSFRNRWFHHCVIGAQILVLNVWVSFILETFLVRMEVKRSGDEHLHDTFVKRKVYMRAKMFYQYTKKKISQYELQNFQNVSGRRSCCRHASTLPCLRPASARGSVHFLGYCSPRA